MPLSCFAPRTVVKCHVKCASSTFHSRAMIPHSPTIIWVPRGNSHSLTIELRANTPRKKRADMTSGIHGWIGLYDIALCAMALGARRSLRSRGRPDDLAARHHPSHRRHRPTTAHAAHAVSARACTAAARGRAASSAPARSHAVRRRAPPPPLPHPPRWAAAAPVRCGAGRGCPRSAP